MDMYAVVLTLRGKAKTELANLRDRYARYIKYEIEPHITVKYPFRLKSDISTIHAALDQIAGLTRPFALVLDGIRYWEGPNNVAYVTIQNRLPVFNLHMAVTTALRDLTLGISTYDLENFTPHLTISENIPDDELSIVRQELSKYNPKYKVEITSFSLFETESNDGREIWKRTREFRLLKSSF